MGQPRFMLAAGASGSGKTLITCGILHALRMRGYRVSSFKCGPDYIDPMFHSRVLGAKSRNLDTFFTDRETTRYLFSEGARDTDLSVMEGVMGYYDGLGGICTEASAYDLADMTETPVIFIVNTKGMSLSVVAFLKGFLEYQKESHIKGVILNQMSPMLYPEVKKLVEDQLGVKVYGYVPKLSEFSLDSRHLGLVLPDEVKDLEEKFRLLAEILEKSLDLDGILELAGTAPRMEATCPKAVQSVLDSPAVRQVRREQPVIAVARDEAFCFIYEDNLKLLREMGAQLAFFSPLHDEKLPERAKGLLLYGGYPELFARQLEENESIRREIRRALSGGMPCMAECGGFMYLHEELEDMEGNRFAGTGSISGRAFRTPKLTRFGYIELCARKEGILGSGLDVIRGHEFHYFDSTCCGEDFQAKKPLRKRSWNCIIGKKNGLWGFPHLYYYSRPEIAAGFLAECAGYKGEEL
ncbi:MAG: cobyrinate a,c-diamide synthase [Candidatus Limivivens sp.]|nr:cobyrinate a,c-diamide synthase [Candidatus Limivivens sp.]